MNMNTGFFFICFNIKLLNIVSLFYCQGYINYVTMPQKAGHIFFFVEIKHLLYSRQTASISFSNCF